MLPSESWVLLGTKLLHTVFMLWGVIFGNYLGQKICRPKVPRIFKVFVPNFAPNFAPNFPRIFQGIFVLRFVGNGDQKKFTKNPRHFSVQNSQANTKKIFTKCFWRAGLVTIITGTLQHEIPGGINYCNVRIAAGLPWKPQQFRSLVAPYCAIPRDYLSDTPLACALWGFWCPNMANWLRYPLPFF